MSRIGRLPIDIPAGVDVKVDGSAVVVKGPKGELTLTVPSPIAVKVEDGAFRAIRPAVATFLLELGIDPGELGIVTVENSRGEPVGTVRTRLKSRVPKR